MASRHLGNPKPLHWPRDTITTSRVEITRIGLQETSMAKILDQLQRKSKYGDYEINAKNIKHNRGVLFWYDLSATCHSKDGGLSQGLYLCRIVLRYLCVRTKLITPDLACPSTHQLLRNSGGDSRPDLSFDKSASLERLFSLARVSLAEASKPDLSFGWVLRTEGEKRYRDEVLDATDPFHRVHFSQLGLLGLNKVITFEHWKSGFFLIDQQAILDAMVWRHLNAAIDNPRPAAGSFNMVDVRRLSAHVIKLRDMLEGVLVLYGLSRVWKSHVCDPVLRGADGNVTGINDFLCLLEWTGAEVQEEPHLDVRPTLQRFPFMHAPTARSSAIIPGPTMKMDLTVDSQGKGIMVDDAAAPSSGVSRPRPSSGSAPPFKDVSDDAIHTDFFPFSACPYYATYPGGGVAGNCEFTREE
ncbi:hypothetical protein Tco_0040005 [Tanacetum coccineum]